MEKVTAGRDELGEFAPKFAQLNDDVLFGEVWSRQAELSPRDRSMVTVTALMASGILDSSLSFHIQNAKNHGVTAQEMAETLDTIAAKYGLALHQDSTIYDDTAAFLAVTGPFIDPALIYPGYAYPDGTFQCDGGWTAADGVERGFQVRRTAKGVFDEVYLNIGDANAYRQWVYETAEGVSLLLAERVDGSHALILADRPESFVTVNILGTEDPLSREDLEAFAEGIDFSVL